MFEYKNVDLLKDSVQNIIENLDGKCSTLKVQVKIPTGSLSMQIQGRLRPDFDYVSIKGIMISSTDGYSTVYNITTDGIYEFDITGYSDIKMYTTSVITSSMQVYATALAER